MVKKFFSDVAKNRKTWRQVEKKMVKNVLVKNITFLERQLNKSIKEVVYPGDNGIDNKPGK